MGRKPLHFRVLAGLFGLALLTVVSGCGQQAQSGQPSSAQSHPSTAQSQSNSLGKVTVGLAVANTFEFLPVYVAQAQGFWSKRGLDVEIVPFAGSAKLEQAIAAGNADLGFDANFTTLASVAQGQQVHLVAAIDNSVKSMGIVVAPGIKSVDDLKGKAIGTTGPNSGTDLLAQALSQKLTGDPQNGIKRAYLGAYQNQVAAMKTGQIQAFVWSIDGLYQAQQQGLGEFLFSFADKLPPIAFESISATNKLIQHRPQAVKAFLDGYFEGQRYLKTHKDYSVALFEQKMGVPKPIGAQMWDYDAAALTDDGTIDDKALQNAGQLILQAKVVSAVPPEDQWVDKQFLPAK